MEDTEELGSLSRWWERFEDERLNQVIKTVLLDNYDIKAALARLDGSGALARIAGASLYPQVDAGFSGSRQKRNFVGFPFVGGDSGVPSSISNLFGISLNVSWEIDLWGRIRAGRSAAVADFQAAAADVAAFQLSLAGQTAKVWFAALETLRQIELAEATLENFLASNHQVWRRYRLGLSPSLEVRLSESNLSNAESVLALRRDQLQRIKRQLETFLGRYPGGTIELSANLPLLHEGIPARLPADLVRRRPDLLAAQNRLSAASARVLESKKALYPRISLTGSAGTSSDELKNLLNGDYSVWNLVGNLLQPIFQGGRLRANVSLAQSREMEGLAAYAQSVLKAYAEVESALAAEELLEQQEAALKDASEQSVAARRLADERYAQGLTDIIAVLEAQRRAYNSQSQLITVQRQRLDNRVDLYLALGGGFDVSDVTSPRKLEER
jgi:NodT family efflux transporter outer membrane factor (OMF) lipoprotein